MLSRLGQVGTFAKVFLVEHVETGEVYALKAMRKRLLIELKQVGHMKNEKSQMSACDHPFLIRLITTFQAEHEVYLVLETALGGELFSLLREKGRFDEPTSRFYAGCVTSALAHLHDRQIVYRYTTCFDLAGLGVTSPPPSPSPLSLNLRTAPNVRMHSTLQTMPLFSCTHRSLCPRAIASVAPAT